MAAQSKRKKHKAFPKGGRPRIQGVEREPNGRPRRTIASARLYKETIENRAQRFGLSVDEASDAMAGTVVGRLVLQELLSRDQYRAAERYIEVRNAYLRAMEIKQDFREPPAEVEGDGDYEGFCARAKDIHKRMMDALAELCREQHSPAPLSALDVILVRDVEMPEMVGDLRLALNCLARHFFGEVEIRDAGRNRPLAKAERSHYRSAPN